MITRTITRILPREHEHVGNALLTLSISSWWSAGMKLAICRRFIEERPTKTRINGKMWARCETESKRYKLDFFKTSLTPSRAENYLY